MIHRERLQLLNDRPAAARARFVLYWMQAAQRVRDNHALTYAVRRANESGLPLVVCFGLAGGFPEANRRHYAFMLQGLVEVGRALAAAGIRFVLTRRPPPRAALDLAPGAAVIVTDRGYLRVQKKWRETVARDAPCSVIQVETEVVVPVEAVSAKEEYAAATLRRKLTPLLETYLQPLAATAPDRSSLETDLELEREFVAVPERGGGQDHDPPEGLPEREDGLSPDAPVAGRGHGNAGDPWIECLLSSLPIDQSVPNASTFRGGESEARKLFTAFLRDRLRNYREAHNDPAGPGASHLSPYLHFGQISPLTIALAVIKQRGVPQEEKDAFLEELIVRRELSMNFVHYRSDYDRYESLPAWALATLSRHAGDERPYRYHPGELEDARTHDPYWNAAQREMVITGKMSNYMRMYWGKKILEWSATPREAFHTALHLNNRYALDGRDPNSFAGVAWCFGKHDRPWGERPIFGTVRYMNAAGLRRKFDMKAYLDKINDIVKGQKMSHLGRHRKKIRRRGARILRNEAYLDVRRNDEG